MSDAEATVKHAIFSGIIDQWHNKNDENFAEILKEQVHDRLFESYNLWAIEDYLQELKLKSRTTIKQ